MERAQVKVMERCIVRQPLIGVLATR